MSGDVDRRPLTRRLAVWAGLSILISGGVRAQVPDSLASPSILKRMSLEQLLSTDVTSVSKRAEPLAQAASAIQVITGEDIRRSGATTLADALRLAANLQVARANSSQWAVSARGYDNVLADKLLVLIDGRTVYTPLYAGVSWDVQDPPLEAIDRIEVISGPGGALWGANAVNGVINVITKRAQDTQGWALDAAAGNQLQGSGDLQYGARLGPDTYGRVYAEGLGLGNTYLTTGSGASSNDEWHALQGGFRLDRERAAGGLTLQGDAYTDRPDPDGGAPVAATGGNLLGRWTRTLSGGSDLQLQLYFDRTYRNFRNGFTEGLSTYDGDWQYRFRLGQRHEIMWGLGARLMNHQTQNLPGFAFVPAHRVLHLYSGFAQDEIALLPGHLRLTIGSKLEHNDYTGWEVQPSARLAWTPTEAQTWWAAASRAVRTPSRIDRDFDLAASPTDTVILGDGFESERLVAYEAGWRLQPSAAASLSLSTYYNEYDDLRSAEPGPSAQGLPITFQNGVRGHAYGVELALAIRVTSAWRLRGGYTWLQKRLVKKPGSSDLNSASAESDDPPNQVLLQSMADLPGGLEWDLVGRWVDALPNPKVADYFGLDARLGWRVTRRVEVAVIGQDLLRRRHAEFVPSSPSPRLIERSVYGKVSLQW